MRVARSRRFTTVPLLLAFLILPLAGCDDDDPTDPGGNGNGEDEFGTVVVEVTHGGAGVGAVDLVLRDGPGDDQQDVTENDGTFTFENVEAGTWEIEFTPPDYFEVADGEEAVQSVTVTDGGEHTVTLVLTPVTEPEDVEISLLETSFDSDDVTVLPGATITWVNENSIAHTVTPDGHSEWQSASLSNAGQTFVVVLNNPGDWDYFCQPHQSLGMDGVVRVEP